MNDANIAQVQKEEYLEQVTSSGEKRIHHSMWEDNGSGLYVCVKAVFFPDGTFENFAEEPLVAKGTHIPL